MGKKKLAVIDDSVPQEEVKLAAAKAKADKPERKKILGGNIKRDEQLKKSSDVSLQPSEKETEKQKTVKPETEDRKPKTEKPKEPFKPSHSKKYLEIAEKVERNKLYPIDQAAELVKEISYSKFDGTLEIHINTDIKNVRGLINLPFASGKKLNIIAFGKGAEESGSDIAGTDEQLSEIIKGKIGFDVIVTTPEWMPKLARAAKVLGPRGLMPNPKNGTITDDLKKTVTELQGGKTEYKTESKANVIHASIGKISQPKEELSQNIKMLLSTIGKTKIKKVVISPTMGPGIKLDLSSI